MTLLFIQFLGSSLVKGFFLQKHSRVAAVVLASIFAFALGDFATASAEVPNAAKSAAQAVKAFKKSPVLPLVANDVLKKIKPLIVIDPGHGGDDYGTHSTTTPRYQEKHLNLATSLLLRDFLQSKGYRTVLTRTTDIFIELDDRALFANQQHPDLFISVHYNSAPSKEAEGIEIYYFRSQSDRSRASQSKLLAEHILKGVLDNTGAKSRGVKAGNFAVIRKTTMPAVLIEGGFLTNEQELQKVKDPTYLKRLAWGMAQGIEQYLNLANGQK